MGAQVIPHLVWEHLLEGATRVDEEPGDLLYVVGHVPQPAAILSGIVRVSTRTPAGRQVTIRYARSGELIGLVPRLSGCNTWEARAMTAVRAALLPLEHIEALSRRQPEILWAIVRDTAVWAAAAIGRVADEAAEPTAVRIARHLLDLALAMPDGEVVAHVNHQALADAVGTAREVVTRTLRIFRILGLLDTLQGRILIADPERLNRVAAGTAPHLA
jgi:CRP/FNR family transcriptional regulator, cyclic AMP receptor protein